jgi:hypothetical protein
MPFYFDESIHQRGGFILGAYVFGPDPTEQVNAALASVGLDPDADEYKSSATMKGHPERQALREELHKILGLEYQYAVVVVPFYARISLGIEALRALRQFCDANRLTRLRESAYFDQGVFTSVKEAMRVADETGVLLCADIIAEQDSRMIKGLQLADLVAHTCALMLVDALGMLPKTVKAGLDSGYDPDLDIELGFELWSRVRYQFFNGGLPRHVESNDDMMVEVGRYGLHIAGSCSSMLRNAALARFERQYWGCIH